MKSNAARVLVGVLLAAGLLGFFLFGVDLEAIWRAMRTADPLPLAAAVVVTLVAYCVRGWRWGEILRPYVQVRLFHLVSATFVGFAASLVVPRSGELLRPWLVARRYRVPASAVFATVIVERLVDLVAALAMFALYIGVLPRPAAEQRNAWIDALQTGGIVATVVLFVLLGLLLALHANAEGTVAWIERAAARVSHWLAQKVAAILHGFAAGLVVLRAPWSLWGRVALRTVLLAGLTSWSFQLVNQAFGIDLPFHTTFLIITFLVVGESIPTPGLVGGFHAFYLLALSEVYGVDRNVAAAASIAAHAFTNLPYLLVGAALLGTEGLTVRRAVHVSEADLGR
jgi:uncharacterized protein (TIRG00374 family)